MTDNNKDLVLFSFTLMSHIFNTRLNVLIIQAYHMVQKPNEVQVYIQQIVLYIYEIFYKYLLINTFIKNYPMAICKKFNRILLIMINNIRI